MCLEAVVRMPSIWIEPAWLLQAISEKLMLDKPVPDLSQKQLKLRWTPHLQFALSHLSITKV